MDILTIMMRFVHIGSAVVLVGGVVYAWFVAGPSMKLLDDGLRTSINRAASKRYARLMHPAIALLLISGAYNWYLNNAAYNQVGPLLHGLLGMKVLLALTLIVLLYAASFKDGMRSRMLAVCITLGLIVIALGAVVRHLRLDALIAGS